MVFYRGIYFYRSYMMEILKPYFNEEEVSKLQQLPNYAETKERIEQIQADKMLDALQVRIGEKIASAKTLEEKWEIFTSSLEYNNQTSEKWEEELVEWWIDFSKLSKEKIEEMAQRGIEGAQEFLDTKFTQLEERWKQTVKWFLGKLWEIPLIGDWLVETMYSWLEEKYETGKGNIWSFLAGLIGIKWVNVMKDIFWNREEEWEWNSEWNGEESPQEAPEAWLDAPGGVVEWSEIQKQNRDRYAFSGKIFLKEISWERFEANNNSDYLLSQLRWTSFWDIQHAYTKYLKNIDSWEWDKTEIYSILITDLGLDINQSISQETVLSTIESIAWVISSEIIGDFLNKTKLQSYGKSPEFIKTFWEDFVTQIKNKDVRELSLTELQICLAYALPKHMEWLFSSPEKRVWSLVESLFSENTLLDQIDNTPLLSSKVGESILSEASSPVMIHEDPSFKSAIKFDEFTESEKNEIELLIGFKDIFLRKLWESKFTLWMPDFNEKLNKGLDYRNLIQIYIFLNGRTDLNNLSDFQSSILCLWIMNTMEDKWSYEWRLLEKLSDDDTFTDIQKIFIAKHGAKISQSFFEKSLQLVWQWRDAIKEITKIKISEATWIPEEQIPDGLLDTTEILLVWWLILWWFAVYRLPLPLHFKVILGGTLHAGGFSAMASVLYDMWTFDKIFNNMWDTEIRKQLDIILEQKFQMNLEEIINSPEKPDFYS